MIVDIILFEQNVKKRLEKLNGLLAQNMLRKNTDKVKILFAQIDELKIVAGYAGILLEED